MNSSHTRVIIGLGNPGERYAHTRHNLGWMVVDELARRLAPVYESEKWLGILGEKGDAGLFKPLTYMNNSGEAVARLMKSLGLASQDILVILDDIALDFGCIRLRPDGTSGGHRGLQSVIEHLGGSDFSRLRVGIGPRPAKMPGRAFVLSRFTASEEEVLQRVIEFAADAAFCWKEHGAAVAMDRFNGAAP